MPNAFELLTENSVAVSGSTAWTHLNSQEGGEVVYILPRDSFKVSTNKTIISVPTQKTELQVSTKVIKSEVVVRNKVAIEGVTTNDV